MAMFLYIYETTVNTSSLKSNRILKCHFEQASQVLDVTTYITTDNAVKFITITLQINEENSYSTMLLKTVVIVNYLVGLQYLTYLLR